MNNYAVLLMAMSTIFNLRGYGYFVVSRAVSQIIITIWLEPNIESMSYCSNIAANVLLISIS